MNLDEAIKFTRATQKRELMRAAKAFLALLASLAILFAFYKSSFLSGFNAVKIAVLAFGGAALLVIGAYFLYVLMDGDEDYRFCYKNTFIKAILAEICPDFKYEPSRGISEDEFARGGVFERMEFTSGNEINGQRRGVKFSLSEIRNVNRTSSADNVLLMIFDTIKTIYDYYADFRGSVLVCEFDEKFARTVITSPKFSVNKIYGKGADSLDVLCKFRIFRDGDDACGLVTREFIWRLGELKARLNASDLDAAFIDNKFYLFLRGTPNFFEKWLFSMPVNSERARKFQAQIREILAIIDELSITHFGKQI